MLNIQDNRGMTALHKAAYSYNLNCLQTLLDLKANLTILDNYGRTPLDCLIVSALSMDYSSCHQSIKNEWDSCAQVLRESGALCADGTIGKYRTAQKC